MTVETTRAIFSSQIEEIATDLKIPKYEAFPRWICENVLGIVGESKIDEAVSIGRRSDYGVDVFHAEDAGDVTEQYVCWIQAKFSNSLDHVVTREEMESFGNTLSNLRRCPEGASALFKQKSAELAKLEKIYPKIRKRMIFAVTGRLNDQVRELVADENWRRCWE